MGDLLLRILALATLGEGARGDVAGKLAGTSKNILESIAMPPADAATTTRSKRGIRPSSVIDVVTPRSRSESRRCGISYAGEGTGGMCPRSHAVIDGEVMEKSDRGERSPHPEQAIAHNPLTGMLAELAALMVRDRPLDEVLNDAVNGVTDVLSVAGVGVLLVDGDALKTGAATNERVARLQSHQQRVRRGPSIQALRNGDAVLVPDMSETSERWPEFRAEALDAGFLALASIPMRIDDDKIGTLDLYEDEARPWSRNDIQAAALIADLATGYVAQALRLIEARRTAEQLQGALHSRIVIEQAKGILAGERDISVDQAFEVLRTHARNNHASLHSIAEAVVKLGLRP